MKRTLFLSLFVLITGFNLNAQAIYVDSNVGDDNNVGTKASPVYSIKKALEIVDKPDNDILKIKVNPGIYVLHNCHSISTEKDITNKRIEIEASVLPGDTSWNPEKMPVIISTGSKDEIQKGGNFVVAFMVNESHVTIRGLKFHGYVHPNTRYFPIGRFNKETTDLLVEQCMFIGEDQASIIQVGVIAHGNEVKVKHCIFHNVRNAVVFWQDSGDSIKYGNCFTNCIVKGVDEAAIWTCTPDIDFKFENNIITESNRVWLVNTGNPTEYTMRNCMIVNNNMYKGNWERKPEDFKLDEINVLKEGDVSLRYLNSIDDPIPVDYLHIMPDSAGYEIAAGLFNNSDKLNMIVDKTR